MAADDKFGVICRLDQQLSNSCMRHKGDDELVHKEVNRALAESRPLTLQKDKWQSESPGTTFSKSELVRRNENEICIVRRRGCGGISVGSACESAARDLRPRILRAVLSGRQLPEHRTRQPLYRWRLPGGQVSASRHDRSSLPSRVIHPASDTTKAKGSASRGALISSKGTSAFRRDNMHYLLPVFLPALSSVP